MSMISELLKDLSSLQTEMQLLDMANRVNVIERAKECIKMQSEKLQAQNLNGGWIPCSERMPDKPYGYLVTIIDSNPMTGEDFENLLPCFAGFDGERWNDGDGEEMPFDVIAWIKLPEPYKEESNG